MSRSERQQINVKETRNMLCNLKAEMARHGVMCKDLENLLGVATTTISSKISCKSQFTFEESQRIQQSYFPDLEPQYLFKEGR